MAEKTDPNTTTYKPSDEEEETIKHVYDELKDMKDLRHKEWRQFGNLTLQQYIDDSDKRLNSFVGDQDKEDWQANVALPTIRNKLKRLIAGFSFNVPDLEMKAIGSEGLMNVKKANIAKQLIQGSYRRNDNPILENFWQAWECAAKGTVVVYEGYLKTQNEQKHIKSYDIETGEIETEKRTVNVDDECISYQLPLTEFYIKDYHIQDVQDQPAIAWVRNYDEQEFEYEFGDYPNADKVEKGSKVKDLDISHFFYEDWQDEIGDDEIEVIRYYNRQLDEYIIIANGVLLLDAPLLWKFNGKKVYPFAKTIWEPFAGKHFFYGKSGPDVMMGLYDIENTLFNTILDKEFRSLVPPLLIGNTNKDAFELEQEEVNLDSKIYVQDINQVSEMPIRGPNEGDISMLQAVAQRMDQSAPSMSGLLQGNDATAREVVIAEEKMKQIKTIHQQMLVDLWKQKFQLRLANIQMNYPQSRTIIDEDGNEKELNRTHLVPNAVLEPDTGEKGTLAVQFLDKDQADDSDRDLEHQADVEEEVMQKQGVNYKKVFADKSFFDNYEFKLSVQPESIYETDYAQLQSKVMEKLQIIAKLFPQVFVANQEEYFEEVSEAFEDKPEPYIKNFREMQKARAQQAQQQQQQGSAETDQAQQIAQAAGDLKSNREQ